MIASTWSHVNAAKKMNQARIRYQLLHCYCYMLHKKTMGYYIPTKVDFTKTYHGTHHGITMESVDFG